jgi:ABC-type transport system involved in multi-copper enzyme maturation permease subunit
MEHTSVFVVIALAVSVALGVVSNASRWMIGIAYGIMFLIGSTIFFLAKAIVGQQSNRAFESLLLWSPFAIAFAFMFLVIGYFGAALGNNFKDRPRQVLVVVGVLIAWTFVSYLLATFSNDP